MRCEKSFAIVLLAIFFAAGQLTAQSHTDSDSRLPANQNQQSSAKSSRTSTESDRLQWLPGIGNQGIRPELLAGPSPKSSQTAQAQSRTATSSQRLLQDSRNGTVNGSREVSVLADLREIRNSGSQSRTYTGTTYQPSSTPQALIQSAAGQPNSQPSSQTEPVIQAAFIQEQNNPQGSPADESLPTTNPGDSLGQLPNSAGQVWRTYDITPYTHSVQTRTRPEKALVDWILKETGTELWFSQPMGILNASRDKLHVYHTPSIQAQIKPIVDRFIQSRGQQIVVGMRLATIASPDWRTSAFAMMQPVRVNSPGVEAWIMTKENAAILAGMLRARSDFQIHNNNDLIVANGQQYQLGNKRPITLNRSIGLSSDRTRYETFTDQINEGYQLDFSALASLDGRSIEAIIGCDINQIEKIQRVGLDLPVAGGVTQPFDLQIPQMVRWSVKERFRWPSDRVLVLSCGVVATPGPQKQALLGIPALLNGTRRRADALMFLEYKGVAPTTQVQPATNTANAGFSNAQGGLVPVSPRR